MTKVSISEAIRMVGVSRSHFYNKYINKGLISVQVEDCKKLIDVSELIRVFGNIQLENNSTEQIRTLENINNTAEKDKIIQLLEKQLQEAKEREEWLKSQLEKTTHLLEDKTKENESKPRKKFLGIF
jgi:hypothetical protein